MVFGEELAGDQSKGKRTTNFLCPNLVHFIFQIVDAKHPRAKFSKNIFFSNIDSKSSIPEHENRALL